MLLDTHQDQSKPEESVPLSRFGLFLFFPFLGDVYSSKIRYAHTF